MRPFHGIVFLSIALLLNSSGHGLNYDSGAAGIPARTVVGATVSIERNNGAPISTTDVLFKSTWTVAGTATAVPKTIYGYIVDTGDATGLGHPVAIFGESFMPTTMQRFAVGLEGYNVSVSQYPNAYVNGLVGHSIWDSAASTGTSSSIIGGHMLAEVFNGDRTTPRSTGTVVSLMLDANVGGAVKYGILQMGANDNNQFFGPIYASSGVIVTGGYRSISQLMSIADSGGAGTANATLTPTSDYVVITCNDADGCVVTLSETGAADGKKVTLLGGSANGSTVADSAGVTELAGSCTLGVYDTLSLIYAVNAWAEVGRSNN